MLSQKIQDTLENFDIDLDEYKEFLGDLETNFNELTPIARAAIEDSDASAASDQMHSIKGSAGSLGLNITYEKAQELEQQYKNSLDENSLANLDELIKIFKEEMAEIHESLQ
ncbi:MAG: hypothetical protein COA79_14285 [Planctomycetota bacterium]|nr:MAG: hypothetical protein COA79_14285 [Planctomycetota bacterium]